MTKQYRKFDREELFDNELYSVHVHAMTSEKLHSKSDIAAELAWRDKRIVELEHVNDTNVVEIEQLKRERDECDFRKLYFSLLKTLAQRDLEQQVKALDELVELIYENPNKGFTTVDIINRASAIEKQLHKQAKGE